jgi:peptide/nickel transport system permease protein
MADETVTTSQAVKTPKRHSLLVDLVIRLVKEKPLGLIGGIIFLLLFFTGTFANFLAPHAYNEIDLVARLSPPSAQHLMGTDEVGRDIFSRIIYGARISMIVGLAAQSLSVVVSIIIGMISGFIGGALDIAIQRVVDAWMCFPGLIILIWVMSILGPGMWQMIVVLGISFGIGGSRIIRSAVMGIRENIYVTAAVAGGGSTSNILIRHILPNIMAPVIIIFSIGIGGVILTEASLSFLGYGIPPPQPSWGGMLSGPGRQYLLQAPWMALWPGLALTIVVFGINMLGDAVRDILDPRLKGGVGRYGNVKTKSRAKAASVHEAKSNLTSSN